MKNREMRRKLRDWRRKKGEKGVQKKKENLRWEKKAEEVRKKGRSGR